MEDTLIQWHPAFVAAMNLELAENRKELVFEKEYNLNTRPLLMDLLVIKKEKSCQIKNEIGEIFQKYNIIEYKSPRDSLDIDTLYKTIAYACLYKSYGETVNKRDAKELTVSLIREAKPNGLFDYCKKTGIVVENKYKGIYYIWNQMLFPIQIIVTKELEADSHIWLKALTEKMKDQEMRKLLEQIKQLKEKQEKEFADSILEVSVKANRKVLNELRGDEEMYQALLEFMEPEITEIKRKVKEEGISQGIQQGIQQLVETLRELGYEDEVIKAIVMKKNNLTEKEVANYM